MDNTRDKDDQEFPDREKDTEVDEDIPDFEDGALEELKEGFENEGCPTCGNMDIQSAELLEAWKEIEVLKKQLATAQSALPVSSADAAYSATVPVNDLITDRERATAPTDNADWRTRYEKIKAAYVKTRLEVSGSFGNWDYATRKRVLENEISAELGFKV